MEHDGENIDAEFRDLVAQLNGDDAAPEENSSLDGGRLSVGLVLAPIPHPEALQSLIFLSGQRVNVVRLAPWSAAWVPVEKTSGDEDDFASLLAEEHSMPKQVDELARIVSRLSKYGAVAVMSWLIEGEGVEVGISGHITARRYVNGQPEDDIPAGVLLGSLPQAAEDLLLGRTTPTDYSDSVTTDGATRPRRGPLGWFRK
ncbi:MAG: hypothetical protein CSA82_02560 [Actinobacteria bacterium]|nr:MAG: hypothetical protein CSA82_02560 [Actinomycetota bacterium]